MVKVVFLNHEYKSKKHLEKSIRKWSNKHKNNEFDYNSREYKIIRALCKRLNYYNLIRKEGIKKFRIILNNKDNLEIEYLNNKNKYKPISWRKCITSRNTTKLSKLNQAMRYSIRDQIYYQRYRLLMLYNNVLICNECFSTKNVEVEHIIPYNKLRDEFIWLNDGNIPDKFWYNTRSKTYRFYKSDVSFEMKWCEYHYNNAEFRLLCSECNKKEYNKTKNN